MNVQDAKNLTIPEGSVKMIHDNSNRLLWGAVGYDTKYAGNTEQQTYSGKNLLPFTNQDFTVKNIHCYVSNGSLYFDGTSSGEGYTDNEAWKNNLSFTLQSGTYTISNQSGFTSACRIRRFSDDTNITQDVTTSASSRTFTLAEKTKVYLGFYIYNVSYSNTKLEVQLELGSTPTPYEPYVVPSPNPDYPQPVNVVTGEQTITVTGKNLLSDNFSDYTEGRIYTYLNDILRNGVEARFTFFDKDTSVDISGMYIGFCDHYEGSGVLGLYRWAISGGVIQSNTTNIPVGYSQPLLNSIVIYPKTKETFDALFARYYIMVELGSTSTAYEPYQSYSYSLSLGSIELCKIGDYQDYIYKSGDDWYVHKEVGKLVLDGSETSWNRAGSSANLCAFYILAASIGLKKNESAWKKFCDNFSYMQVEWRNATSPCLCLNTGPVGDMLIFSGFSVTTTLEDWKTWLSTHNTTVYYVLNTPTDTKITDATLVGQLNDVHEWLTRYGYESTVSGDLPIVITKTNM